MIINKLKNSLFPSYIIIIRWPDFNTFIGIIYFKIFIISIINPFLSQFYILLLII